MLFEFYLKHFCHFLLETNLNESNLNSTAVWIVLHVISSTHTFVAG